MHKTRDSEFTEYDDLDLTDLRMKRFAEIRPMRERGKGDENLAIY